MDTKSVNEAVKLFMQIQAMQKRLAKTIGAWPMNSQEMKEFLKRTK